MIRGALPARVRVRCNRIRATEKERRREQRSGFASAISPGAPPCHGESSWAVGANLPAGAVPDKARQGDSILLWLLDGDRNHSTKEEGAAVDAKIAKIRAFDQEFRWEKPDGSRQSTGWSTSGLRTGRLAGLIRARFPGVLSRDPVGRGHAHRPPALRRKYPKTSTRTVRAMLEDHASVAAHGQTA